MLLCGYSDSDLRGDVDDRKSTTGIIFYLGSSPLTWLSNKQRQYHIHHAKLSMLQLQ